MSALRRAWNSAVFWAWGLHALRMASVLFLLPLLLRLPGPEYGFFFVLANLASLMPLLDLGFLATIDRSIGYAMSGARELRAHGLGEDAPAGGTPNFDLLWRLLHATRALYRLLSIAVLVALGLWGTHVVALRVGETSAPGVTWAAWALTLLGGVLEMYSGWWNVYLRGLNEVVTCTRIQVLCFGGKLVLSCLLLLAGAGLLAVPLSALLSSWIQRSLSRRFVLRFLAAHPEPGVSRPEIREVIARLWPNSWRSGLYFLSGYLVLAANTYLCLRYLGLAANGQLGLSLSVTSLCQGLAHAWIFVKWPLVVQLRARQEWERLRRLLRQRLLLLTLTYAAGAAGALLLGPWALAQLSTFNPSTSPKELLPLLWLAPLLLYGFLETHFGSWAHVLLAGNRLPHLWPTLLTHAGGLALTVVLLETTSLGVGAIVLGPLVSGCVCNYWYWPRQGARELHTRFRALMLGR